MDTGDDAIASKTLGMGADNEIREALINLIFNAVDAMPNGGSLTLRTRVEKKKGTRSGRGDRCGHRHG
jgi:signal transduction histidine kinase